MPYSSQVLIQKACAIAKAPGFVTQAGQYLNLILQELYEVYDFDYIRKLYTLSASPVAANGDTTLPTGYPLAADHLRCREVFYYVNGEPFYLIQMPLEKYDQLYNGPGVSNYPTAYAVDPSTSPETIYFYEPLQIPLTIFIRYQPIMPDITNPETSSTVPWFTYQKYLIKKIAADLMNGDTDDARGPKFEADAQKMLSLYLEMKDDKENYAQTVKLDRNTFRGGGNVRPTKQQPL